MRRPTVTRREFWRTVIPVSFSVAVLLLVACGGEDDIQMGDYPAPASIVEVIHRGEEFAPSGLTRTVLDLRWDKNIDKASLQPEDFWVGGNTPVEVLVSPRDPAVVQLYFNEPPDQVGGSIRIPGDIKTVDGGGIWNNQSGIFEAGWINDQPDTQLLPPCYPNCPSESVDQQQPAHDLADSQTAEAIAEDILATVYPYIKVEGNLGGITGEEVVANVELFLRISEYTGSYAATALVTATPSRSRSCDDGTKTLGCRPHYATVIEYGSRSCFEILDNLVESWSVSPATDKLVVVASLEREWLGLTELRWDFFPLTLAISPHPDQNC